MSMQSERQNFLVRLPVEDHKVLRSLSFYSGRSMNEIVCQALHTYLAGEGRAELVEASIERGREDMRELLDKLA